MMTLQLLAQTINFAGSGVECGKQSGGAVAFVVVRHGPAVPFLHRQAGLGVVQRSYVAPSEAPVAPPANLIIASEEGLYSFVSMPLFVRRRRCRKKTTPLKPTPEVRSFGRLVGHVANASYMFCSHASGEANPMKNIEKTKTSKTDLVSATKDAVAYCNQTFDSMTDAKGSQMAKLFNFDLAKLTLLSLNTVHTDERYGNMVTIYDLKRNCAADQRKSAWTSAKVNPLASCRTRSRRGSA